MGIGYGMMQGLGKAIQNVGNIWGPERLEEKRRMAEDARRELETQDAMKTSALQRKNTETQMGYEAQLQPGKVRAQTAGIARVDLLRPPTSRSRSCSRRSTQTIAGSPRWIGDRADATSTKPTC